MTPQPSFTIGFAELLILVALFVVVPIVLYFAWWRPRRRRVRGFDVSPVLPPDPNDRRV